MRRYIAYITLLALATSCNFKQPAATGQQGATTDTLGKLKPVIVTDTVANDTDDPAIWINPADPAKSLVVGTDKDQDGALYVFNLEGKIVNKVPHLKR
ncbi:MAG: phytase, partial [Mucilaginibacter sp.]